MSKLINVGYGNYINSNEILAVINTSSNDSKRKIKDAKDKGKLIDVTEGNKSCSAIITKTEHIFISSNRPETLKIRFDEKK